MVICVLAVLGAIAAVAGIAYAVYRYLNPRYLEKNTITFSILRKKRT